MKKKIKKPHKSRKPRIFKKKALKKVVSKKKVLKKKLLKPKKIRKTAKKAVPVVVSVPISEETVHRTKIRVLGIGGGGGSIISEISPKVKRVDFMAANTDSRALRQLGKKVKKFQFGQALTKGLGTGMNADLGEMSAHNEREKIKKIFEGQDLCIIIATLGGGTGSGSTPVFAKIARSLGIMTYGIFTLPFGFEGEKKMEIARVSLEKIKPHLNAYSIIPNERIFQIIDKKTPLQTALSSINKKLAENLEGLIEMIYLPGLINIDFADLRTILDGRGRLAYLNTIVIDSPNKEEAIKKVISSPLYPYTIRGARGVLYDIAGGKNLQLSEVSEISKIISESINKTAKIVFGISQSKDYGNKIKITVLATGCGAKQFFDEPNQQFNPFKKLKAIMDKNSEAKPKKAKPKKRSTPIKKAGKKTKTQPKKTKPVKKNKNSASKEKKEQPVPKNIPEDSKAEKGETKVRRTALEVKKVVEEEEKKILEEEKTWETPAIFRKKQIDGN